MKLLVCCLIGSMFYAVLADGIKSNKIVAVATDKSDEAKPKRDASLLNAVYHGPSYKYLPPASLTYSPYSGSVGSTGGFSGGYVSGIMGGYRSVGASQGHRQQAYSSSALHNHGGVSGSSAGHHGFRLALPHHYVGVGATKYVGSGLKGGTGIHSGPSVSHGEFPISRPHYYAVDYDHGSLGTDVSGLEYNVAIGNGYKFSKGAAGSSSSLDTAGYGSLQGLSGSGTSALDEEHHTDHVHNGSPEHFYVISHLPVGVRNSHNSLDHQGHQVASSSSYQSPFKHNSYGEPVITYNKKYHSQTSPTKEHGPIYAAGHKGLGYFSFTSNKPTVIRTGISASGFKQPAYSKVAFKPSTFLGSAIEESAHTHAHSQQYLPPSGVVSDSTGYDYPIPSAIPSINYQDAGYQQSVEVKLDSLQEPTASYLPPKSDSDSLNEISLAPSSNFLPPSNTYGSPYSNLGNILKHI